MRGGSLLLVAFLGVPLARASLTLEKKDVPATVDVPFEYGRIVTPKNLIRDGRAKRKNVVDLHTSIEDMIFFHTNITVGTPPQDMQVYFNLQGNECWMHAANSTSCQWFRDQEDCDGYGGYNTSISRTAEFVSYGFEVNDQGPNVTGDFFKDTVTIGSAKLDSMKLGVAYEGITSNSIGLGYGDKDSASVSLPQALADAKIINSPAFSMWTELMHFSGGKILFGGVNKAKYVGTLYTLPIVPGRSEQRKAFRVNMTGLSINDTSLAPETFTLDAIFDNRGSLTYFPEPVVSALAKQLGVDEIPESGQFALPCSLEDMQDPNTNITFAFGSAKFEIPIGYFVTQVSVEKHYTKDYENCYSGIVVNKNHKDDGSIVLGTKFLTWVYSVFDLANDEVSLADRRWDSVVDNIVEITTGDNAVPGATSTVKGNGGSHEDKKDKESTASAIIGSKYGAGVMLTAMFYLLA